MPTIKAFIQARMSSNRFPGKVLASFRGEPLIRHVVREVSRAIPFSDIVVTTSSEPSDDPVATYVGSLDINVFRGPLDNVFDRFSRCVARYPCDWILRISADSPLLDPDILRLVIEEAGNGDYDLISTIYPRTFPRGRNAELIKVATLLSIRADELSAEDQEHVTPCFYRDSENYRILNVRSSHDLSGLSLAVDTIEDLRRVESLSAEELKGYSASYAS
jgi:spore coat polysaccharide biosynthesis protein SpsF (cytidylyltransferase family)